MSTRHAALVALSLCLFSPAGWAQCPAQAAVAEAAGVAEAELAGGCGGNSADLQAATNSIDPSAPPNLNAPGDVGPPPMPTAVSADVQAETQRLSSEFQVDITGQWTPQALQLLENSLAFYRQAPELLRGLQSINLQERGNLGNTGGTAAFWQSNGQAAQIQLWGFQQNFGEARIREHVVQHEIGHHVTLTNVGGADWRQQLRASILQGPDVSRYGSAQRPDEKTADWWAAMLSTTRSNQVFPNFRATPTSVTIAQQRMPTQLNPAFQ